MKFIRSIKELEPVEPNGKSVVYMLGYGGRIWQAKRHIRILLNEGYQVITLDFIDILKNHDPQDLISLMDEVSKYLKEKDLISKETILLGVSLGGLVGYNLIRKHKELNKLLVITGGDMTHIPSKRALKNKWKITHSKLSQVWNQVNIYTEPSMMKNKHVVMLLPKRDRVINPSQVRHEIAKHTTANDFTLVSTNGGHFRTIITETILLPKRSLKYIKQLERF